MNNTLEKIKLKLKIENINNKVNADCFIHIWINLGLLHKHNEQGMDIINTHEFIINDNLNERWQIHDIGKQQMCELPNWMCVMSHNMNKKEFINAHKIEPDTVIYFIIFKKIT